jgi:predicted CopG family antitoxin
MEEGTILIKNRTRRRLKQLGVKGETYDELINQLIDMKKKSKDALDSRFASLQSSESSGP